jgi:hypothetical protein
LQMYGSTMPVKVPIRNLALGGIVSNDNQDFKLFNYNVSQSIGRYIIIIVDLNLKTCEGVPQ